MHLFENLMNWCNKAFLYIYAIGSNIEKEKKTTNDFFIDIYFRLVVLIDFFSGSFKKLRCQLESYMRPYKYVNINNLFYSKKFLLMFFL